MHRNRFSEGMYDFTKDLENVLLPESMMDEEERGGNMGGVSKGEILVLEPLEPTADEIHADTTVTVVVNHSSRSGSDHAEARVEGSMKTEYYRIQGINWVGPGMRRWVVREAKLGG